MLNLSNEMGHACFRLALVLVFSTYLLLAYYTGHISDFRNAAIGVLAFFGFALLWIIAVGFSFFTFKLRRLISIVLDQAVFAFAMYQAGDVMAPVTWGPVLMAIGNGLRNGPRYAKLSAVLGAAFNGVALHYSPYWNLGPLVYEGIIASILILPWYTVALGEHIAQAKRAMQARAAIFESAAKTDSLTELLNRSGFFHTLQNALDEVREKGARGAVMLLDLDGFKAINDECGHAAGDNVLKDVAARLRSCLRSSDRIARIGGDEFGVVLGDVPSHEIVERLAQKIIDSIAEVRVLSRPDLRLGASIGICTLVPEGRCVDGGSILDVADRLMYQAKRAGKNQFRVASAYAAHLAYEAAAA